jgi:hypothetical protein
MLSFSIPTFHFHFISKTPQPREKFTFQTSPSQCPKLRDLRENEREKVKEKTREEKKRNRDEEKLKEEERRLLFFFSNHASFHF